TCPGLPAAAEALVERHQRERLLALARREQVLLVDELLLGDEDRRVVHGALGILLSGEIYHLLRGISAVVQRCRAKTRPAMCRERPLQSGLGGEDRVRVVVHERLVLGVLHAHVVRDAPVVEDRPAEVGPPKASKLRPSKNLSASSAWRAIDPTSD